MRNANTYAVLMGTVGWVVLIVILVLIIASIIALYVLGKKAQKKQAEQQAFMGPCKMKNNDDSGEGSHHQNNHRKKSDHGKRDQDSKGTAQFSITLAVCHRPCVRRIQTIEFFRCICLPRCIDHRSCLGITSKMPVTCLRCMNPEWMHNTQYAHRGNQQA